MAQTTRTFSFNISDTDSEAGEALPIPDDDFSALSVTNNSGQTISYSVNGGTTWSSLAVNGVLSYGYGLKSQYLFRKSGAGWISLTVTVTYPGLERATLRVASGIATVLGPDNISYQLQNKYIAQIDKTGVVSANDLIASAIDAAGNGEVLEFPANAIINVSRGYVINKRVGIRVPQTSRFRFIPTTAGTTLFEWNVTGTATADYNEEFQLDGVECDCRIESNRTVRANGVRFIKCDNVNLNLRTFGLKGFSLDLQKSRETSSSYVRTRFCGYMDAANPANNVPDIILQSPASVPGDTTNFCKFSNLFCIYPFGQGIYSQNATQMDYVNNMIHALPEGNTANENTIITAFGGTAGWTGSTANNEYAGLHVNPGATTASVSGKLLDIPFRSCPIVLFDGGGSQAVSRLTNFEVYGSQVYQDVWADNGAVLQLNSGLITAASSSQYAQSLSSIAADTLTMAGGILPATGQPCDFVNAGGALPTGIAALTTYYIIKVSATTCKIASNRANALAGTALTVSGGTGTNTLTARHGYNLLATGGSKIYVSNLQVNDGYKAAYADASSTISGHIDTGTIYNQGEVCPVLTGSRLMFVLRNANLAVANTDVPFTKIGPGFTYSVDKVLAVCRSGSFLTACTGGVYANASKTGTQIVPTAQSWAGLTAAGKVSFLTGNTTDTVYADGFSTPKLNLTTANAGPLIADIYIYGFPVDN